jgi:hypothetical protein
MAGKPYLMVLSYRGSLEAHAGDIERIGYVVESMELGPTMVLGGGVVIGFTSAERPRVVHDAVRSVVGDRPEIVITELGPHWTGSGAPEMEKWLAVHLAAAPEAEAQ